MLSQHFLIIETFLSSMSCEVSWLCKVVLLHYISCFDSLVRVLAVFSGYEWIL